MQLRKLLSCLLIGVVLVLAIVPSVHAQTTSIKVLSTPPSDVISSGDTARFDATVQVSYTGAPQPQQELQQKQAELLVIGLYYPSQPFSLNGTVSSSNDICFPAELLGQLFKPGLVYCAMLPYPYAGGSGTESVSFHAIIYNATAQKYHFEVLASFIATTAQQNTVVQGSDSYADFFVSVVNQAQSTTSVTSYVPSTATPVTSSSATPSLQMPQPPQPESTQSTNNTQQLVLALAVVAAVVIAAVFLYSRRKGQTVTPAEKVDTPVAPMSTKTVEGKRYCIECGNELSPNLNFCDSCGAKQP
jgi:hypothetical protein